MKEVILSLFLALLFLSGCVAPDSSYQDCKEDCFELQGMTQFKVDCGFDESCWANWEAANAECFEICRGAS